MRTWAVEIECFGNSNLSTREIVAAIQTAGFEIFPDGIATLRQFAYKGDCSIKTSRTLSNPRPTIHPQGIEFNSPVFTDETGYETIARFCEVLNRIGVGVNSSCGLHVHIGNANLTIEQTKMIVERYAKFEDKIDGWMAESRRADNNVRFCKSVKHIVERVKMATARTPNELAYVPGDRYYKVNLQSCLRQPTVEFRQHGGTIDAVKINSWVKFLHAFIEKCVALTPSTTATVTARVSSREPRRGSKQWRILNMIRNGRTNDEIAMAFGGGPKTAFWATVCLTRDYGLKFRSRYTDDGLHTYYEEIVETTTSVSSVPSNETDGGVFDGVDEETRNFLTRRAAAFAAGATRRTNVTAAAAMASNF